MSGATMKDENRPAAGGDRRKQEGMTATSAPEMSGRFPADSDLSRWMDRSPRAMAITVGASHVIRYVNPEFCRLVRSSRELLVGCRLFESAAEAGLALLGIMDRAFHAGETIEDSFIPRARPGLPDELWSYSAWPLCGPSGSREGVVLEVRDRTPVVGAGLEPEPGGPVPAGLRIGAPAFTAEERQLAERVESANRAKSDFLSMMSHELRTPLAGILGHAEVLEMGAAGPINALQLDSLSRIKQCSAHLLDLIEGILSFARADQQAEQLECVSVDLCTLAREAADLIQPLAIQKGLDLRLFLPEVPIDTRTDPKKVRQILVNLLTNAVKFTDAGEVTLDMRVEKDNVSFHITDTGVGIESADLSRVFEPFVQAEPVTTRRFGGAGLGLPISQGLVARLGGELSVESVPGRGSTFSVHLPVAEVHPQAQVLSAGPSDQPRAPIVVRAAAGSRRRLPVA
jgi:signal transduction histidine kinase